MNKKILFTISKGLCVLFTVLFGALLFGTQLAFNNEGVVSAQLGQPTFAIENTEGVSVDPLKDVDKENYPWYFKPKHENLASLKEDTNRVCEEIEKEGAVLLYNKEGTYDNGSKALPIKAGSKVSFFSTGSQRLHLAGQGSHGVSNYTKANTYIKSFTDAGHTVNQVLWDSYKALHGDEASTSQDTKNEYRRNRNSYARGYKLGDIPWQVIYTDNTAEVKSSIEEYSDAAIFCVTRQGGEGVDMWPGKFGGQYNQEGTDMLKLTATEKSVLRGLTELRRANKIKRIIINLNVSNAIGMEFLNDPDIDVDAVFWTGGMGERGIYAVPKLLDGTANFSGSMPFTVYYDNWDDPSVANFCNNDSGTATNVKSYMMHYTNLDELGLSTNENTTSYVVYREGIYIDYRYPETRYEDVVTKRSGAGDFKYNETIAYTHGYGLSYTDFELSNLTVNRIQGGYDCKVSVTVKNTGNVAGKKAVQLYAQKAFGSYDIENNIEKAAVDFVGFGKTQVLEPGASETLEINVKGRDFVASYDAYGAGTFVVTPGTYYLAAGNNAHDALNNILAAKGKTKADGMDADGNKSLTWSLNVASLDTKSFAFSSTGQKIENLFDDADLNRYSGKGDNHIDYTTRTNWVGTTAFFNNEDENWVKLELTGEMMNDMWKGVLIDDMEKTDTKYPEFERNYAENPLKDEKGNVILNKNLTVIDLLEDEDGNPIPTTDERWDWLLNQITWDELQILVSRGFRHTEPAKSIGLPQSFEFNESNGVASGSWDANDKGSGAKGGSIPGKALAVAFNDPDKGDAAMLWPGNCVMTATLNLELCEECGKLWGEEGNWAGYSGLYGPGANTYRNAYGGRHYEYFGPDSYGAGMAAAAVIKGMQSEGMFAVIKHFGCNEAENYRKTACIWVTEQTLREVYLRQFEYVIVEGGAMSVMNSMGRIGPVVAPSHRGLQTGWLHGETGLKGFATTDVMSSKCNSKIAQIKAGCDLSDDDSLSSKVNANLWIDGKVVTQQVELHSFNAYKQVEGEESGYTEFVNMMRNSAKHIIYAVLHSNAMNGYSAGTKIIKITPPWEYLVIGLDIGVGVLLGASFVFLGIVIWKQKRYVVA